MADTRIKDLKNYEGDNNGFMAVDSNMHGTGRLTIKQLSQKIAGGDLTIQVNGASTVYSPVGQAKTVVIDAATHDELQAAERRVEQKVTAETSARESADTELDAKIDTTAENAATALSDAVETLNGSISSVQSNVNAVAADLAHETELRESADGVINDRIDGHIENTANPHAVSAEQVGLGNVDNKSEATIKADFTGEIAEGNEGFVTGGAAYTALGGKQDTLTFDNVPTENSDNPVKSGGVFSEVARLEELVGTVGSFEVVSLTAGENPVPDVDDPSTKVIYLTKEPGSTKKDPYTEWIWTSGVWEVIGETTIDLSDYATKQDLDTKQDVIDDLSDIRSGASAGATAVQPAAISDMAVKSEMTITAVSGDDTKKTIQLQSGTAQDVLVAHQDISGKADKSEMSITPDSEDATKATIQLKSGLDTDVLVAHQDISGKQDVIDDLSDIRSGAALGETAYQKPEQGIPNTDLAQAVQDVLVPASTAQDEGKVLTVDSNGAAGWQLAPTSIRIEWDGTSITLPEGITWKDVAERPSTSFLTGGYSFDEKFTAAYPGSPEYTYIRWSRFDTSEMTLFNVTVTLDPDTYEFISVYKNGISDIPVGYLTLVEPVEGDDYYTLRVRFKGQDETGSTAYNTLNYYNKFSILVASGRVYFPTRNTAYYQPLIYTSMPEAGYYYTMSIDSDGVGHETVFNDLPSSTSSDSGKTLTVNSSGVPEWATTAEIAVYEIESTGLPPTYTYPSGADIRSDLTAGKFVLLKLHLNNAPPGWYIYYTVDRINQTSEEIKFVPICDNSSTSNFIFTLSSSNAWSVETVSNTKVPDSTTSDEGKVLMVNSSGAAAWMTPSEVEVVNVSDYPNNTSALYDYICSICNANKTPLLRYSYSMYDSYYVVGYSMSFVNPGGIDSISAHSLVYADLINVITINTNGWTFNQVDLTLPKNPADASESDLYGNDHVLWGICNGVQKLTLTTLSSVTIVANNSVPNFLVEIDNTGNSNAVTVTVKDSQQQNVLKHSSSAGNIVGAGKYVQVTCVGSCWTLAEFVAPTP